MWGTTIGVIKGDTRSLDYASHASCQIGFDLVIWKEYSSCPPLGVESGVTLVPF